MSEKKLSYKPGIAFLLWAVMVFMHGGTIMRTLEEKFVGLDPTMIASGIAFLIVGLMLTGLILITSVIHDEAYGEKIIIFAAQNEKHLCPNCAKLLNDNKLCIQRIKA